MSNSSTILHKRSTTPGAVPALTSLSAGELAINVADGKLFVKTSGNAIESFSNDSYSAFILDTSLSGVEPRFGNNSISQSFANVLGGIDNDVSGGGSTVVNGSDNDIAADYAFIGNGSNNTISAEGDYGAILGGQNNTVDHNNSFILGSNITSHAANFTYVNNISAQGVLYGDGSGLTNLAAAAPDTGVRALTANWQSTYLTVSSLSASWASSSGEYLPLSGGTLTGTITGDLSATGSFYGDGSKLTGIVAGDTVAATFVRSNSANWNSSYTTVQSNSANWQGTYAIIQSNFLPLSGGVISVNSSTDALRITQTGSGKAFVVEDITNPDSTPFVINQYGSVGIGNSPTNDPIANGTRLKVSNNTELDLINGQLSKDLTFLKSNTNDYEKFIYTGDGGLVDFLGGLDGIIQKSIVINTSINAISSENYDFGSSVTVDPSTIAYINYDGSTFTLEYSTSLFGSKGNNWDSAYTTVQSNSSTNWDNGLVNQYTHTNFLPLSGGTLTGTITGDLSATGSFYGDGSKLTGIVAGDTEATTYVRSNSANWQSTYTTVQSNSATTWNYKGTDIKNLSSGWVGGNDAYTNLVSNSAAYLSVVDLSFLSVSANWDSAYTNVNSNSANWQNTYTSYAANSSSFFNIVLTLDPLKFVFIGDNTTTNFTVSGTSNSTNASVLEVLVDSVRQEPTLSYTLSADIVSFNTAPSLNSRIVIITPNNTTSQLNVIKKHDFVQETTYSISYAGIASLGVLDSSPSWRITKTTFTDNGSVSATGYKYDSAWSDRLILNYNY